MQKPIAEFRENRESDAESMAYHANNIKIWNNLRDFFPHPYGVEDARRFISYNLRRKRTTDYVITIDDRAVGAIGIVPQSDIMRVSAEIGFWLGEEFWNKGVISNLLPRFVEHVFRTTSISHLYAMTIDENRASMRVLEKAGFRFVGTMHKSAIKNSKMVDMHYYEIFKQ